MSYMMLATKKNRKMPNLKKHCLISKKRTGNEFKDLHEWMDEGHKFLGQDHRFERHSGAYIPYVMETWGKEGVKEFLNHIIEGSDDFKINYIDLLQIGKKSTIQNSSVLLQDISDKIKEKIDEKRRL